MRINTPSLRPKPRSLLTAGMVAVATVLALASCSSDAKVPPLSEAGKAGHTIYLQKGCASCHGSTGGGGAGPALIGLYGTEVELTDGTTVVADDAYLASSISDPEAQIVAGFSVKMPKRNGLSDDEISEIVTFIKEIGPTDTATTADATASTATTVP